VNAALVGGMCAVIAVLAVGLLSPQRKCPECATPLPKVRKPMNRQQALWGGWTCPKCGIDVDRKGRKRS